MQMIDVNLMPWRKQRRLRRGQCAVVGIVMAFVVPVILILVEQQSTIAEITVLRQQNQERSMTLSRRQVLLQQQKKMQQQYQRGKVQDELYTGLVVHNKKVRNFLGTLTKNLPDNVVLKLIHLNGEKIHLAGQTRSLRSMLDLMKKFSAIRITKMIRREGRYDFEWEAML